MERKIGEIFEYNGEWYQTVKSHGKCMSCDLLADGHCVSDFSLNGSCFYCHRKDGENIMFKKLEKVGKPFERHGYFYQEYKIHTYPLLMNGGAKIPTTNGFAVIIKQNKEDMEEKNNNQTEDTPLKRLVSEYINNKIEYSDFEKRVKRLYVDDEGEKLKLIPFDLSKAKAGRKTYTRDGKPARIVDFGSKGTRPIVALVTEDEEEVPYKYNTDGSYNCSQIQSDYDLFLASKKVEGWININAGIIPYETKEEAEKHSNRESRQIKVSWEN